MTGTTLPAVERELRAILGADAVLAGTERAYLTDATESRNLRGRADAVVLPATPPEVAEVVTWCYRHDVPLVPRGGGTGFAGGAVPIDGGVVVSLERMRGVRALEPHLWRAHVEAGVRTATLRRLARESGLLFPPDPGAAEQSQVGGNIATDAGGPHAFKYGTTGAWVSGLEAVVAPGELISVGGPIRKDVAGYDVKSLLIGSEGTLGIITAAWLKLTPAPAAALPVVGFQSGTEPGCAAVGAVLANGLAAAALEYFDGPALEASAASFPCEVPAGSGFMVIAEADGSPDEAARLRGELLEVLGEVSLATHAPTEPREVADIWRWREGVSLAVQAVRGGKVSEDIVVPVERLAEVVDETREIGRRHSLGACSWGHAGDGNLHSTLMIDPSDGEQVERAEAAAEELFALATRLGGSISGEHGLGWVKRGQLARQWGPRALELHAAIKQAFDPKGLFNPGKKQA